MKDKLEVGMYVKVLNQIRKIINLDSGIIYFDKPIEYLDEYESVINIEEFNKFKGKKSFNPIDLIEVGDYVNGWKVLYWTDGTKIIDDGYASDLNKIDIKSIVTKEMFSSMEYRLGEE